jgi:hypothetical protein
MKSVRVILVLVAAMLGASLATLSGVASAANGTLVSGPSPFAACSTPAASDVLYPNAEVEPAVASNPARPSNLVAVWQQDRWSGGGANGIVAGYSFDGGRSWGQSPLPFSVCAPGGVLYNRASDPAVSIGPDGTAYAIGLSFDLTTPRGAITAAVSKDGGRTWSSPQLVSTDETGGYDKEWITADPVHAGTAYAVWDNAHFEDTGHFTGPALFSKTTDFGQTWSAPIAIAATGADEQSIGNQILVDPRSGRLYDTYGFYFCACASIPEVAYVTSDDGGVTWSSQHVVNAMLPVGVAQPGTLAPVRSSGFPVAAISPTGAVFLAWEDSRFSGGSYDEIAVASTRDGGRTWSAAHRANRPTGRPAFTPSIAVGSKGTVAVSYYDLRRDDIFNAVFSTDFWGTTSRDGIHFGAERHLAGSFDLATAPFAQGLFIGDYEGLAAVRNDFVAVFAATNCDVSGCEDNPTDIYSAHFAVGSSDSASPGPSKAAASNSTSTASRAVIARASRRTSFKMRSAR